MGSEPKACGDVDEYFFSAPSHCEVDDVPLMQPVGFVWHSKPRYRVKALTRIIHHKEH